MLLDRLPDALSTDWRAESMSIMRNVAGLPLRYDDDDDDPSDAALAAAAPERLAAAAATPPELKYAWPLALLWCVLGVSAETLRPSSAASSSAEGGCSGSLWGFAEPFAVVDERTLSGRGLRDERLLRPRLLAPLLVLVAVGLGLSEGALVRGEWPPSLMVAARWRRWRPRLLVSRAAPKCTVPPSFTHSQRERGEQE